MSSDSNSYWLVRSFWCCDTVGWLSFSHPASCFPSAHTMPVLLVPVIQCHSIFSMHLTELYITLLLWQICLSIRHISLFCPDEWRYDHVVFSIGSEVILASEEVKFIRIFARDNRLTCTANACVHQFYRFRLFLYSDCCCRFQLGNCCKRIV